ncbi:polysaccharide export outer membrane protein [Loktanella sp. DSM 29012]|uniref:polysaccharide biosynthesis/export family protein n=1 Tax=Loktanella sp. DSM 29012 TaxID=1881056 RepID=UPI0008C1F5C4|nr:polysaccharide biosynthesis/export family protein [Loktanella sp. DSM 29012]SEQ78616.1 polysaccharide export outer membrane protein [Loktanella sp. DSM 29012]
MNLRTLLLGTALALPTLALTGCGSTYVSSTVSENFGDLTVREIKMTAETIRFANSQPYSPRSLPAEFFQTAGAGSLRGAGALPAAPDFPDITPQRLELRPPPQTVPGPYTLGTGDAVRLTLAQSTALDATTTTAQELTVRDDGTVSIPQVGSINVAGMTVEDAEAAIFSRLISAGIDPNFSLDVVQFNARRAAVGGAVRSPRVVPITLNPPSLNEALLTAGGLQVDDPEFASIRIYRDGTLYQIPLADFRARTDLQNLTVLPGDAIFVDVTYDLARAQAYYQGQLGVIATQRANRTTALSELSTEIGLRRAVLAEERGLFQTRESLGATERDYVFLVGEVSRQTRFPLPFNQQSSLADALFENGGFNNITGNPAQIYVMRADPNPAAQGAVTAWHLDARNAAAFTLAPRFELRPDDIIFVQQQPITRWNRAIAQAIPSLLSPLNAANQLASN